MACMLYEISSTVVCQQNSLSTQKWRNRSINALSPREGKFLSKAVFYLPKNYLFYIKVVGQKALLGSYQNIKDKDIIEYFRYLGISDKIRIHKYCLIEKLEKIKDIQKKACKSGIIISKRPSTMHNKIGNCKTLIPLAVNNLN